MSKTITKTKYVDKHITLTQEENEQWEAFKTARYNGMNAMSMIVRKAMQEYIEKEVKAGR